MVNLGGLNPTLEMLVGWTPIKEGTSSLFCDCHRLGQIPGLVHIEPPLDSQMVAEQLQGHYVHNGLQRIRHLWHLYMQTAI